MSSLSSSSRVCVCMSFRGVGFGLLRIERKTSQFLWTQNEAGVVTPLFFLLFFFLLFLASLLSTYSSSTSSSAVHNTKCKLQKISSLEEKKSELENEKKCFEINN
uniref:Transmembrane protein n=1 Tax=Cacopsylla melanoneura TaxID=428564 RepID=A0A8D9BJ02_9HEMI